MRAIVSGKGIWLLRFDPGEEAFAGISVFLEQRGIAAAEISGIGSASSLSLAYYDAEGKRYLTTDLNENLEVVSLLGSGGSVAGDVQLHLHGTFGRRDLSALAGHVASLTVLATLEVVLRELPGQLSRRHDDGWNLRLLEAEGGGR